MCVVLTIRAGLIPWAQFSLKQATWDRKIKRLLKGTRSQIFCSHFHGNIHGLTHVCGAEMRTQQSGLNSGLVIRGLCMYFSQNTYPSKNKEPITRSRHTIVNSKTCRIHLRFLRVLERPAQQEASIMINNQKPANTNTSYFPLGNFSSIVWNSTEWSSPRIKLHLTQFTECHENVLGERCCQLWIPVQCCSDMFPFHLLLGLLD